MTRSVESDAGFEEGRAQLSLGTAAARNLSTTTKSVPQMQGISSRWLLRVLPWVQVSGGTYRVNRRLTYTVGDGRITFSNTGSEVRVIPPELGELPILRGFTDTAVLETLADRFTQHEYSAGDVIVEAGQSADRVYLIAHGKLNKLGTGKYDDLTVLGVLADGEHFGDETLTGPASTWAYSIKALTRTTVLSLTREAFQEISARSETLRAHLDALAAAPAPARNKQGEAAIAVASGHTGEPTLPTTFADYELKPREYELSVAQTVLQVHTRVADLYNEPMDQIEQQLRLTIEALRERQENELVNNPEFGLLHNADLKQRIHTRSGPPTPDDLDELISRRRKTRFLLAHPRAIAAFGRECTKRGVYPQSTEVEGHAVLAWRGIPLLPCDKIPVTGTHTSSILALRTGEEDHGVIGLHQAGIPHEYQPSLSVRFMGISEKAIISYLVTAYYSAAVLVPDALGILEDVEVGN
ncbi:family 2B encapsulin nanocompartment shell protein [Allostreptomyces psammosilenae]|uniref:family 2B encapsulin nanocompartment shell protein n=1 Tax=Allostreptomyces psammosilenae TaxID=1892865 RepID=UPI0028AADB4B|nr:family 2B encapsulin nanocompartment shell protein [Allostreptomyces psammosilenae]